MGKSITRKKRQKTAQKARVQARAKGEAVYVIDDEANVRLGSSFNLNTSIFITGDIVRQIKRKDQQVNQPLQPRSGRYFEIDLPALTKEKLPAKHGTNAF